MTDPVVMPFIDTPTRARLTDKRDDPAFRAWHDLQQCLEDAGGAMERGERDVAERFMRGGKEASAELDSSLPTSIPGIVVKAFRARDFLKDEKIARGLVYRIEKFFHKGASHTISEKWMAEVREMVAMAEQEAGTDHRATKSLRDILGGIEHLTHH